MTQALCAASLMASVNLGVRDPNYPHVRKNFYSQCAHSALRTVSFILPPTPRPKNYLLYAFDLCALEPAAVYCQGYSWPGLGGNQSEILRRVSRSDVERGEF